MVDGDGQWHLIDVSPAGQYDGLQRVLLELTVSAARARLLEEGDHLRTPVDLCPQGGPLVPGVPT